MQIQKLFTVYDQAAEIFLPPFFVPSTGIAKRAFKDCVNSPDHQFGKHPQDYTLFYLGEFKDDDGTFNLVTAQTLGNGVEYVDHELSDDQEDWVNGQKDTPLRNDEDSEHTSE